MTWKSVMYDIGHRFELHKTNYLSLRSHISYLNILVPSKNSHAWQRSVVLKNIMSISIHSSMQNKTNTFIKVL